MLLQQLKAYSPSPDAIERMALAVQHTSEEVVAALRSDAFLNHTRGANADIPAFAFLLADAEYHEAVVRVLQGKEASQVVIKAVLVAYGNLATVGGVGMYKELINTQGMLEGKFF